MSIDLCPINFPMLVAFIKEPILKGITESIDVNVVCSKLCPRNSPKGPFRFCIDIVRYNRIELTESILLMFVQICAQKIPQKSF